MNREVSKQLSKLLGQVPVSELEESSAGLTKGWYITYPTAGGVAKKIACSDFYDYLCKNVFLFLTQKNGDKTKLIPEGFMSPKDTPLTFGRRLYNNVRNWIGEPKDKNITDYWFKHFQYHYFDKLDRRVPTILLKYGPAKSTKRDIFDIIIWIDSSPSMKPEVNNLIENIEELCNLIYSHNENNRISIIENERSGYLATDPQLDPNSWQAWQGKGRSHILDFTSNVDNLALTKIQNYFSETTARWQDTSQEWMDENLWYTAKMVENANWDPAHKKIFIAISDESCDAYVSVTGQLKVPYVAGHGAYTDSPQVVNMNLIPDASNKNITKECLDELYAKFDVAEWGPYVVPNPSGPDPWPHPERPNPWSESEKPHKTQYGFYDSKTSDMYFHHNGYWQSVNHPGHPWSPGWPYMSGHGPQEYITPKMAQEWEESGYAGDRPWNEQWDIDKIPGTKISQTTHWQWNIGGFDANVNNVAWRPWGSSDSLTAFGYTREKHNIATWAKAFNERGVKFFFLETEADNKLGWLVPTWRNVNAMTPEELAAAASAVPGQIQALKDEVYSDGSTHWDVFCNHFRRIVENPNLTNEQIEQDYAIPMMTEKNKFQYVSTAIKWIFAYNYLIEKDLLSHINAGGAVYTITPDKVVDTLKHLFEQEIEPPGYESLWCNSMWETHLQPPKRIQVLPTILTKAGQLKWLFLPNTAVVSNPTGSETDPDNFIWKRFNRRDYIRIVNGGWDPAREEDLKWTDEDEETETNENVTDSSGVIHNNIGDVDQTLKSIEDFLDDLIRELQITPHKGKIIFTASKEANPLGFGWHNVLTNSNQNESFVWSGDEQNDGENTNLVPGIIDHEHNTIVQGSSKLNIQNVSVIGRPEGETVGGTAGASTVQRVAANINGREPDTVRPEVDTRLLLDGQIGPYTGTVIYSQTAGNAIQQPHNNMPMYYKVRAFRYDG